ncbi:MAG: GNAT family N-acetyltransferase [Micrococcales bacterium 73-15]|uniref:GNAT family N-acetyltransferase n=1 Tax=Salana multivorans TaxID=120377 RepID=UPI000962B965|nr:GNAT family N-acetyltransferase [Salana multivorans]OJX95443.1 MAG: GNAT family N-acetyltransferase [Micrococcales bacterium 73-15]
MVETERLRLRGWRPADAVVHRELWTERDPRVPPHRRISADGHPSIEELEAWIRGAPREEEPRLLVVELRESGEMIGYCGLVHNPAVPEGEPELAYELLRRHWGRGYATEAARAIVERARAAGYPRLWASVRDWNTASRGVLAKLGFVESGRVEPDAVHGDSIFTTLAL